MIIKFSSVDTIDEAGKLRGKTLEIEHRQLQPLPADSYYHFQLIGLEVRTVQGEILGEITEIIATGSNDNYVVRNARGETLIPAIADVVKAVDIERGVMTIEAMDGLLDLNRKTV
jgi:16S rRNA processing protein RimM